MQLGAGAVARDGRLTSPAAAPPAGCSTPAQSVSTCRPGAARAGATDCMSENMAREAAAHGPTDSSDRPVSHAPDAAPSAAWTSRARFLAACRCQPVDRTPIWFMRQAGRALPEYRALRERYSFLELVQTPELAVEVTLQPVRRFGFDAAILFSDILVIPEAMGQRYQFRDGGGVALDFALQTRADIERLSAEAVCERLDYVARALRLLRTELAERTALIGFSGSPWTLATFMLEGGSAARYTRALALFREDRTAFDVLMEKLTTAVTAYLRMQMAAGADALQLFDSHGGLLDPADFPEASGRWMRDIVQALQTGPDAARVPVIVFSLGTHGNWEDLVGTGAEVLGIDWRFPLSEARRLVPGRVALQGNLAPAVLREGTPESAAAAARAVLEAMRGRAGHIFNLGHGLTPDARLENIASVVETVKHYR
ncbi:MAG: uroporphyrinogen decarboxylase [Verrucomicrobiales bacterium]|nr:uroporphyrinogen decarboxylase [Verrucomicrobiales bacterium]